MISLSDQEAIFHSDVPDQHEPRRITYRLTSANTLVAIVTGSDESGEISDSFELVFSRQ